MKEYIQEKTSEILSYSENLAQSAGRSIRSAVVEMESSAASADKDQVTRSVRPYLWMGGAGILTGLVGRACSSSEHSGWAYLLCGVGLASLAYGMSQRQKNSHKSVRVLNYNQIIRSQLNLVDAVLDQTKESWGEYMEKTKDSVQKRINSLTLDEETRAECMEHTYYVEQIDIDSHLLNERLRALPHNEEFIQRVDALREEWAEEVEHSIQHTAQSQVEEYQKIKIEK